MPRFVPSVDVIAQAQRRLAALGHDPVGDPSGVLGEPTSVALQAFQRERGLSITGRLDAETWGRLLEAGWSLGDRLLYVDRPLLRGDDVAALQEALALLGFNPGRIDGIFGPLSEGALADFQRNCGLEPSGVLSRSTLNELTRLSSRSPDRLPVTETRDSASHAPERERLVVIHGDCRLADLVLGELATSLRAVRSGSRDDHEGAALANDLNAGLLLAIEQPQAHRGITMHFFESYRSRSVSGVSLAEGIAVRLASSQEPTEISGMSLPILRETLMPALMIVVGANVSTPVADISHAVVSSALDLIDSVR